MQQLEGKEELSLILDSVPERYTHVIGLHYTVKVGLTFCADWCLWLSEQEVSLLSRW